jgi:uncharacterized membrane protein
MSGNREIFGILLGISVLLGSMNVLIFLSDSAQAANYDVDILKGGFTSGQPGDQVSFLFDVKNTGDTTDAYSMEALTVTTATGGDTDLWFPGISLSPETIYNLNSGDTSTVQLTVNIPFPQDLYLIPSGVYEITVQATSMGDPGIKDTQVFE